MPRTSAPPRSTAATNQAVLGHTVSRRLVAATETALAELLAADLAALVALMVDGVHFGEHCCVVALGIDGDGAKLPLALIEAPPRTPPWSPS